MIKIRPVTLTAAAGNVLEQEKTPKCPTSFRTLDNATNGGWKAGDLIAICGGTNVGKTPWALRLAVGAAKAGYPTAYLSTDMTNEELAAVIMSGESFADCPGMALTSDDILYLEKDSPYKTYLKILLEDYNDNLLLCGSSSWEHTFEEIPSILEYFPEDYTIKHPLIFIDYIQKIRSSVLTGYRTEKETIDTGLPLLKKLAVSAHATVFAVCAIHRDYYDTPEIPLQGLRSSSNLEYDTDVVMTLQFSGLSMAFSSLQAKTKLERNMELVITKQRFGAVGKKIHFHYFAAYNYFVECESEDEFQNALEDDSNCMNRVDDFLYSEVSPQDVIEVHGSLYSSEKDDSDDDFDDIFFSEVSKED